MSACCWAPGFCYSGRAGAFSPAVVAEETPDRRAPAATASAVALTAAAPPAAYVCTPEQIKQSRSCFTPNVFHNQKTAIIHIITIITITLAKQYCSGDVSLKSVESQKYIFFI